MFDTLSDRLQHALGDLRGKGRLDEEAISKAMRRLAAAGSHPEVVGRLGWA